MTEAFHSASTPIQFTVINIPPRPKPIEHFATSSPAGPSQRNPSASSTAIGSDEEGSDSGDDSAHHSKKRRRSRPPPIALDPNQPPTARGTPRERVYVACHECRSRRVRCDGAKPACSRCKRRHPGIESCTYDDAPRRRGVDRAPGVRMRSAVGHRAPRKPQLRHGSSMSGGDGSAQEDDESTSLAPVTFEEILHAFDPSDFDPDKVELRRLPSPRPREPLPIRGEDEDREDRDGVYATVGTQPSTQFARDTWWDALLTFYCSDDADPRLRSGTHLTAELRYATTKDLFVDLHATMSILVHWSSFVHPRRLFENLVNPARRALVQPSLLLSMLAIGALVHGSELKNGARGRRRALKLIEDAHSALQASLSSNWIDVGLVQAAWFMACFEFQGHPEQSWARRRSAMVLLDSMIRLMSLTSLDANLPHAKYVLFHTYAQTYSTRLGSAPARRAGGSPDSPSDTPSAAAHAGRGCECNRYVDQRQWTAVSNDIPLCGVVSMWPAALSEGEILKEECRRTVWSSVILSAAHYCVTGGHAGEPVDLFISDYRGYALLLPGEALSRTGVAPIRQDNVWSLYIRARVLCQTGTRYQSDATLGSEERARFATHSWLEADAIAAALARHTCDVDKHIVWQARDALATTKMNVSFEIKKYAPNVSTGSPDFYRQKILAWLLEVTKVGSVTWERLQTDDDARRPIIISLLLGNIIRALRCYEFDSTLVVALDAVKTLAVPTEYLMRLWPCKDQRETWQRLRYQLVGYCVQAGVDPPKPWVPPIGLPVPPERDTQLPSSVSK